MKDSDYKPTNCTALYDAIGDTLETYKEEDDNSCCIITDGEENSSRKFDRKKVFSMITEYEDKKNWIFTYLAANQDAFAVGSSFGMRNASQCKSFAATTTGMREMHQQNQMEYKCQRGYQVAKKKGYGG